MSQQGTSQRSKTVQKAFLILEFLRENNGGGITETSQALDIPKSTVHRLLDTLYYDEYVVKEKDTYYPSLKFLEISDYCTSRKKGYEKAGEKVDELAEDTGERSQFIVEEHGKAAYVYQSVGENAVISTPSGGSRKPIYSNSAGKAILAHIPEEKIHGILDQADLESLTENTITNREELFDELVEIRERGYSINDQENLHGHRAVGVPILTDEQEVIGALSVSGPVTRMKGTWFEEELPNLLLEVADELELYINHS